MQNWVFQQDLRDINLRKQGQLQCRHHSQGKQIYLLTAVLLIQNSQTRDISKDLQAPTFCTSQMLGFMEAADVFCLKKKIKWAVPPERIEP